MYQLVLRPAYLIALAVCLTGCAAYADEAKPPKEKDPTAAVCEMYANLMKQQRDALEVSLANALSELRTLKTEKKDAK